MEKKIYLSPAVEVLEFMDEIALLAGTEETPFDPTKPIDVETGGTGGGSGDEGFL